MLTPRPHTWLTKSKEGIVLWDDFNAYQSLRSANLDNVVKKKKKVMEFPEIFREKKMCVYVCEHTRAHSLTLSKVFF